MLLQTQWELPYSKPQRIIVVAQFGPFKQHLNLCNNCNILYSAMLFFCCLFTVYLPICRVIECFLMWPSNVHLSMFCVPVCSVRLSLMLWWPSG